MTELLGAIALMLVMLAFLLAGRLLRTESVAFFSGAWALLAAAGACVLLSEQAPALRIVSYAFGSLFPFAMLVGALRYAGRQPADWLVPLAIGVAVLRVTVAAMGMEAAAGAIALGVDPLVLGVTAAVIVRAARGRALVHRVMPFGFVLLAAVEAWDSVLQMLTSGTSVSWSLWLLAAIPLAAFQVLASFQMAQAGRAASERALKASEAHLRDARIGSFTFERGAHTTRCSEETRRILGLDGAPDVPNRRLLELVPEAERARVHEAARAAAGGDEPFELEVKVRLDGSGERSLLVRVEPAYGPGGAPLGLSGTVRDVTEARRAAEALRRSEERLRAILASLVHTRVAVLSRSGQVSEVFGERNSARRYGLPAETIEGRDAAGYAAAEDLAETRRVIAEVFRTGEPRELLRKAVLPTGVFWFDNSVAPLHSPSGEVSEVLVVARDVTEQVRADEERRRVEARLLQAQRLESLGVLAGGIAHDFNNLLVGILGNAELALRAVDREDAAFARIEDVREAATRAAELTAQLLAYAGKSVTSPRTVELAALVAQLLPMLRTALPAGASLELELAEQGPFVRADPGQLGQVLLSLMSNAVEALGERGGRIRLRTAVQAADARLLAEGVGAEGLAPGDYALLEVADDGAGIEPGDLARVFEPFFTTHFTGRGLGLAAVLGIVRSHGGVIRVESRPGAGSTFQVLLPIVPEAREAPREPAGEDAAPRLGVMLLVVDDEPMVRTTSARMLGLLGYDVLPAGSADEAMGRLAEAAGQVGGALLDLTMPDCDGMELFDRIREKLPRLPIVLMSGHSPEEVLARVAGRSHATSLAKPFGLTALEAALAQAFDGERA